MIKLLTSRLIPRVLLFRKEAVQLAKAFFSPHTPLYLKVATAFAAFYLINPIDIIPDFIPFVGWVDDLILIPMLVSWIVSRLPVPAYANAQQGKTRSNSSRYSSTIDGSARRL